MKEKSVVFNFCLIETSVLNEDLADRFSILKPSCSNIYCTMIRLLSCLGSALLHWLTKESIPENMQKFFREAKTG